MKPLLSVIILTYNNIHLLDRAFKSVVKQSYDNVQVIIADDGSFDVTKETISEVIDKYDTSYQVVINVNERNLGTVRNYNNAIKIASGDIIVPLACDDSFVDENVLEDIVTHFETTGCLVCSALRKGEKTGAYLPREKDANILKKHDAPLLLSRLSFDNIISGATLYFRRDVFDRYGFFDEKYVLVEDFPYVFHLVKEGVSISFMDRVTIVYGQDGVSCLKGKRVGNQQVEDDKRKMLIEDIGTSLELIKNKKMRRYIRLCVDIAKYPRRKFIMYLKYMDVAIYKVIRKIKAPRESMFWIMYKGD